MCMFLYDNHTETLREFPPYSKQSMALLASWSMAAQPVQPKVILNYVVVSMFAA